MGNTELAIIMPSFFIRSKTNRGELCKQRFLAAKSKESASALIVVKLVLTDNYNLYRDFELVKEYKGKYLFRQDFSIKVSTLSTVVNSLIDCNVLKMGQEKPK